MMRYFYVIFLFLAFVTYRLAAQHDAHDHDHTERCGTMHNLEALKEQDPALEQRMQQIDREIDAWLQANAQRLMHSEEVITIPVVVHVVYSNATQNISDAQIQSQIAVLNKDFRKQNPDTINIPSIFKPLAADVGVEFCLATQDPYGNATNGITRTQTTNTNFTVFNNAVKYSVTGGKDAWPRDLYLNIWVCSIGGGILGYAQFPGGSATTDGVVIDYRYFGTMGTVQAPFNKGRTATHEIGHWLNLRHIWGDDGGACTADDLVNDTPMQGGEYYGCPSYPKYSCGSEDMFMNYMDYVNDACMYMFTAGQRDRMIAAINIYRGSLLTSSGCISEPPMAQFAVDQSLTIPGCGVQFANLSTGLVQDYQWIFENGTPATSTNANPGTVVFFSPGSWDVTLIASNSAGADTFHLPDLVTVSDTLRPLPSFAISRSIPCTGEIIQLTDQSTACADTWNWTFQPATVTFHNGTSSTSSDPQVSFDQPGKYTVSLEAGNVNGSRSVQHLELFLAGGRYMEVGELFEADGFATNEWTVENPDGDFTWEVNTVPAVDPNNHAAVIPIHGTNSLGHRDRLIMAPVNLENATQAFLSFKHAYAQYQVGYSDSLIVYVSDDCGQNWTRVFSGGEDGSGSFATAPATTQRFVPSGPDQWCGGSYGSDCKGIDLSAWTGKANIRIAFESFSFISNNIYLDDIRIATVLSDGSRHTSELSFDILPNPSNGAITIKTSGLQGKFSLRLNNMQGSLVYTDDIQLTDDNYLSLVLPALPAGVYLMNLVGDSQVYSRKLILR